MDPGSPHALTSHDADTTLHQFHLDQQHYASLSNPVDDICGFDLFTLPRPLNLFTRPLPPLVLPQQIPRAARRVLENEWMRRAVHIDPPTGLWPLTRGDPIYARIIRLVAHDRRATDVCGLAWVRSGAEPFCTNPPDTSKSPEGFCLQCACGVSALMRHVRSMVCDPSTGAFEYSQAAMQRVYDFVYAAACTWTFSRRAYQASFTDAVATAPAGAVIDAPATLDALEDADAAPRAWIVRA